MMDLKKFVCIFILTLLSDTYYGDNIGLQNGSPRIYKSKHIFDSTSITLLPNTTLRSPQRRLLGGKEVKHIKQFPYMVWIMANVSENQAKDFTKFRPYCGGSIIGERFILTAAHCVTVCKMTDELWEKCITKEAKTFRVYSGGTFSSSFQTISEVKKVYVQPNYTISDLKHKCLFRSDMALLELKKPLRFSNMVKKVKLPKPVHLGKDDLNKTENNYFVKQKKFCTIAGFGETSNTKNVRISQRKLKFGKIPLIDIKTCVGHLKISNEAGKVFKNKGLCTDTSICSYDEKRKTGICFGDSGSPLTCGDKQFGVVSWSSGSENDCVGGHVPDIYSRVDVHVSWILSVIKKKTKTIGTTPKIKNRKLKPKRQDKNTKGKKYNVKNTKGKISKSKNTKR